MTREQAKTFREQRLLEEQKRLAEQGISSAFEGKFLVTIGDSSCNYYNFKHFITTQIFGMGIDNFVEKTDWDKKEASDWTKKIIAESLQQSSYQQAINWINSLKPRIDDSFPGGSVGAEINYLREIAEDARQAVLKQALSQKPKK